MFLIDSKYLSSLPPPSPLVSHLTSSSHVSFPRCGHSRSEGFVPQITHHVSIKIGNSGVARHQEGPERGGRMGMSTRGRTDS
ncbi:hypothetical protein VTO73DRAFT_5460 [Trametes versicolor]